MPQQPHILLITMDELRRDALSCYGARAICTPALDGLAQEGWLFRNAYTPSPVCLPARCALATGRYPHNNRAYSNFRDCSLDPNLPNIYNQLRAAGYFTAHVGKCHYTPAPYGDARPDATLACEDVKDTYMDLGMDHLVLQNGKFNSIWFWNDYSRELEQAGHLNAYREACWNPESARVFPFTGPAEWHPDAWLGRKTVEFLAARHTDQPLFLWTSFSGPHYPFDAPREYYDRVDSDKVGGGCFREDDFADVEKIQYGAYHGQEQGIIAEGRHTAPDFGCKNYTADYWFRLRRAYLANVVLIDEWIGHILAAAESRLGDNLLVLFTTDHGEMLGNHRLWGKNNCGYDDVVHVPLLMRVPDQGPGGECEANVSLIDILPTCLGAAGREGAGLDGRPLTAAIAGEHSYPYVFSEAENFVVVTDGHYKYIHLDDGFRPLAELYDLEDDPHEFKNQVRNPDYAPVLAQMRGALASFLMKDLLP